MKKSKSVEFQEAYPYLKSPKLMAKLSGIGENTLRSLMDKGDLEFLLIGNRRLLCNKAIRDYYRRNKVSAQIPA